MLERDTKGRFVKGNRCGGRKQTPQDFKESLLKLTAEALMTIVEIMRSEEASPALRLRASESILDRAFGKPAQMIIERTEPEEIHDDNFINALSDCAKIIFMEQPMDEPKGIDDLTE